MPNYTHPMPENVTSVPELLTYINSSTNDLFGVMILLMIWAIMFAGFKTKYRLEESFAGASYLTMLTAVILFGLELISGTYLTITVLLLVIAVFLLGRK